MKLSKISFSLIFVLAACGPKATENIPSHTDLEEPSLQAKKTPENDLWFRLADALKIDPLVGELTKEDREFLREFYAKNPDRDAQIRERERLSGKRALQRMSSPSGLIPRPAEKEQLSQLTPEQLAEYGKATKKSEKEYDALVQDMAEEILMETYKTRAHSIEKFTKIEGIKPFFYNKASEKVDLSQEVTPYHLVYRPYKNAEGEAADYVLNAMVLVPNKALAGQISTERFPLLSFAHGQDSFSYEKQVTSQVGELQRDHIVIAPIYPGESTDEASAWQITSAGENILWATDVHATLAAHECIAEALTFSRIKGSNLVSSAINKKNLAVSLRNTAVSHIMGASRGGLVAGLAVAYNSAYWYPFIPELKGFGDSATFRMVIATAPDYRPIRYCREPVEFSSFTTISGVSNLTAGKLRLILRQAAYGKIRDTDIAHTHLKSIKTLAPYFDEYIKTKGNKASLQKLVREIQKRDLTILAPLVVTGVRKWETVTEKVLFSEAPIEGGKILVLHGIHDQVVPFDQSVISFNIWKFSSENKKILGLGRLGTAPVQCTLRTFEDPKRDEKKTSQHLDQAFWRSEAVIERDHLSGGLVKKMEADSSLLEKARFVCKSIGTGDNASCLDEEPVSGLAKNYFLSGAPHLPVELDESGSRPKLRGAHTPSEVIKEWRAAR